MSLHTPIYLLFLAIATGVYWLLPRARWQKLWLVAASYVFYAAFDARFALLLLGLTLAEYWLGPFIAKSGKRRFYFWLSVVLNLGVLGLFKYLGFFLESAGSALGAFGLRMGSPTLQILLPIGISFYVFQSISYSVELDRKKIEPAKFLDLALLLAFFPKLIAGPLVRPEHFLPQLTKPTPPTRPVISNALQLLILGLIKKVVIADSLASLAAVAFRAAGHPAALSFPAPLYWQGFYLYAFQIYADFSGYTDLARASAMLFNIDLPENFRQPYFATSIGDFWNRWHMTATQWFREQLFFPLSRQLLQVTNRRYQRTVQVFANFCTMVVIGLWHGANWTFVIWGAWHGLLLSVERLLNLKPGGRWRAFLMAVAVFHLVGIGWVFFGASSPSVAVRFLMGMASLYEWQWLPHYILPVLLTAMSVFAIDGVAASQSVTLLKWQTRTRPILITASVVLLVSLLILRDVNGANAQPFIYGRF